MDAKKKKKGGETPPVSVHECPTIHLATHPKYLTIDV
jgi:hypothetical protein